MLLDDNTSQVAVAEAPASTEIEIVDQDTLEKAIAAHLEPVKEDKQVETTEKSTEAKSEGQREESQEKKLYFGRFDSIEDAEKSYLEMQQRSTKAEQALADLKKEMEGKSLEEIKALDYDKQFEYLLAKVQESEKFQEALLQQINAANESQVVEQDQGAVQSFIKAKPLLQETGLGELFAEVATSPTYREYTLDSIYEVKFKPKLDKLMGTKISIKEKPLQGGTPKTSTEDPQNELNRILNMSPKEFAKNEKEILKKYGIK